MSDREALEYAARAIEDWSKDFKSVLTPEVRVADIEAVKRLRKMAKTGEIRR